jgi:hypothetical protein
VAVQSNGHFSFRGKELRSFRRHRGAASGNEKTARHYVDRSVGRTDVFNTSEAARMNTKERAQRCQVAARIILGVDF